MDALEQELEERLCRKDETYFLETYTQIQHPSKGRIPFLLRPAQEEILEYWNEERYSICLKARQVGWSTLVAYHCLWLCLFRPDTAVVMLSKGEREAAELLSKARYAYKSLPPWMRERLPKLLNKHMLSMRFGNESQIESLPSAEDPARGHAVYLVVIDEWAFLADPEQAWAAIEPVADVGGSVIGLSTAKGSGNFFHSMWIQASDGIGKFKPHFYPWHANTDRDVGWYAGQKESLMPWQLAQEYPSNPEEAFVKSGNMVFDHDMLKAYGPRCVEPVRGFLVPTDRLRPNHKQSTFVNAEQGELAVWALPDEKDRYVVGADVAQGLEHGDFSAAHVISVRTGDVVAHYHARIDTDLFGEFLAQLGHFYRQALLGVEANNHGVGVLNRLRFVNYPRIYYRRSVNTRTIRTTEQMGWFTSKVTKPLMIDELNRDLRQGDLGLKCQLTLNELRQYIRDEKGRMHGSPYDDRVTSLAIANQMRLYGRLDREKPDNEPKYWTVDEWHLNDKRVRGKTLEDSFIGAHNLRDSW